MNDSHVLSKRSPIHTKTFSKKENMMAFDRQSNPLIELPWYEKRYVKYGNILQIVLLGLKYFMSIRVTKKVLLKYEENRRLYQGDFPINKVAKVGNKYYRDISVPGFPSKALKDQYIQVLNRIHPIGKKEGLMVLYFSITNKCALQCKHCYEWEQINKPDVLSTEQIIEIIKSYQENSLGVLFLEGGEPMQRVKDIYKILPQVSDRTDCWIITSGHLFTLDKAHKLREAGLTGVMVSIDHYDELKHNNFRGHAKAFEYAINAVISANKVGLVTGLSLYATKEFTSEDNLIGYMEFAKKLGVSYVQILESRAVGRFTGKDSTISGQQTCLLDNIYLRYNTGKKYLEYPFITMPSYHQRRVGCYGSGQRYLFIDSEGQVHSCPFCRKKIGDALAFSSDNIKLLAQEMGCHKFIMADKTTRQ